MYPAYPIKRQRARREHRHPKASKTGKSLPLDPLENTNQGSQFTSAAVTGALAEAGVAISMDGRGRWMDNGFIERLGRSLT